MKFSIIIPIYKTPKVMLDKCIQSILKQTYTEFELILVDDGSPDKCGMYCDEYAMQDKRVKVIHTENRGAASARNTGIEAALGEWIIFVDSDDWLEENAFELINNNVSGDIDVLIFNSFINDGNKQIPNHYFENERVFEGEDIDILQFQTGWKWVLDYYPPGNSTATPWGKAYKTALLKENNVRFPTDMRMWEDTVFNLYVFINTNRVKYIMEELYHHVFYSESISNQKYNIEEEIDMARKIRLKIGEFNEKFNKSGKFDDVYNARVTNEALFICQKYRYNKKELNKIFEQEPYKTALYNVNPNHFTQLRKYKVKMLKHRNYFAMNICEFLKKNIIDKLKKQS